MARFVFGFPARAVALDPFNSQLSVQGIVQELRVTPVGEVKGLIAVRGPLVFVSSWVIDEGPGTYSVKYTVHSPDGKPLGELDVPFEISGDPVARLFTAVATLPAIGDGVHELAFSIELDGEWREMHRHPFMVVLVGQGSDHSVPAASAKKDAVEQPESGEGVAIDERPRKRRKRR